MAVQMLLEQKNIYGSKIIGVWIRGTARAPILLDGNMRVLRSAILWSDQISHREVLELKTEAEEEIQTSTWNGIDCTWTLPQLLWMRRNEPDTYGKIQHLMTSKDYIVYRFTGRITSDFSSAVSSLLVDANTLNGNIRLVERAGLRLGMLPDILSPTDIAGQLTNKAAQDLGLSPGTCVAIGFLDSAAELVGVGAVDETIGVIRLGSAGGVMVSKKSGKYRKNCLAYPHPVKPLWYYQAGTNACTTSLLWVRNLFSSSSK